MHKQRLFQNEHELKMDFFLSARLKDILMSQIVYKKDFLKNFEK